MQKYTWPKRNPKTGFFDEKKSLSNTIKSGIRKRLLQQKVNFKELEYAPVKGQTINKETAEKMANIANKAVRQHMSEVET